MGLVGMFFFRGEEEFYQVGRIIDRIDDQRYLIEIFPQKDNGGAERGFDPINASYFDKHLDDAPVWTFFSTREALDAYVQWITAPLPSSESDKATMQ
jgi:hypothetical protein